MIGRGAAGRGAAAAGSSPLAPGRRGAGGAAGRGLAAAAAGARLAGAPRCGRERSMGRRLLRALLCLLLLAGRGLLRDGGASATAAHGETGTLRRAAPSWGSAGAERGNLPGERQGRAGGSAAGAVIADTTRGSRAGLGRSAGAVAVPAPWVRHRRRRRFSPGTAGPVAVLARGRSAG